MFSSFDAPSHAAAIERADRPTVIYSDASTVIPPDSSADGPPDPTALGTAHAAAFGPSHASADEPPDAPTDVSPRDGEENLKDGPKRPTAHREEVHSRLAQSPVKATDSRLRPLVKGGRRTSMDAHAVKQITQSQLSEAGPDDLAAQCAGWTELQWQTRIDELQVRRKNHVI